MAWCLLFNSSKVRSTVVFGENPISQVTTSYHFVKKTFSGNARLLKPHLNIIWAVPLKIAAGDVGRRVALFYWGRGEEVIKVSRVISGKYPAPPPPVVNNEHPLPLIYKQEM